MILRPAPALLAILVLSATLSAETGGEMVPSSPEEPVYKVLFESGFYAQALEYIESRLDNLPDSSWVEHRKYGAFCLILLERRDEAVEAFGQILTRDPSFNLDPIYTSPKIYEVFRDAQKQWQALHPPADTVSTDTVAVDTAAPSDTAQAVALLMQDTLEPPVTRAPLYLLPGGVGQFHNGQRAKGFVLLGIQLAGLVGSVATYQYRDNLQDPDYGWYEGNRDDLDTYTTAYRLEFGVFLAAYLYSVIDAFATGGREGRRQRRGMSVGEAGQ